MAKNIRGRQVRLSQAGFSAPASMLPDQQPANVRKAAQLSVLVKYANVLTPAGDQRQRSDQERTSRWRDGRRLRLRHFGLRMTTKPDRSSCATSRLAPSHERDLFKCSRSNVSLSINSPSGPSIV
jgi:hypothetical protein